MFSDLICIGGLWGWVWGCRVVTTQHLHSSSTWRQDPLLGKRHLPLPAWLVCAAPHTWPAHMPPSPYDQLISVLKLHVPGTPRLPSRPGQLSPYSLSSLALLLSPRPGSRVPLAEEAAGSSAFQNSPSADSTPGSVHSPVTFPCWDGVGHLEAAALGVGTAPPSQLPRPAGPTPWGCDGEGSSATVLGEDSAKGRLPHPHRG